MFWENDYDCHVLVQIMICHANSVSIVSVSIYFSTVSSQGQTAADSKQLALKQAEEMEHQRMEHLIRHRLRQISQVGGLIDWLMD